MGRSRRWILAVALGLAACTGSSSASNLSTTESASEAPTTEATAPDVATTTATATTIASTTSTTVPPPVLDLTNPLTMFAPVPPKPVDKSDLPLPDGSADFFELFEHPESWGAVLDDLGAFKLHGWMVKHYLSDDELVLIADVLRSAGVPLIIEAEPLQPPDPDECDHTESFEGPYELDSLRRLRGLGVVVAAVAIEQPLHFGHLWSGDGACRYELDRIFDELVTWRAELRSIYPDAAFGSIEAVWDITTADHYAAWLDGWQAAAGEPFDFQHLDINWLLPDWIDKALAIERVVESRGVPFGILYNGGLDRTNDGFIQQTMNRIAEFDAAGGSPAHTVVQSWVDVPDRVLPIDDVDGFAHLLARARLGPTVLDVLSSGSTATGTVTRSDGSAVSGGAISIEVMPIGGGRGRLELSDVVPAGVTDAFVVMRINAEDAVIGDHHTTLFDVRVTQDGGPNLVRNGGFDDGLTGWGVYDTNSGTTTIESIDADAAMVLRADPRQEIWIDGAAFAVTAGEQISLAVDFALAGPGDGVRVAVIYAASATEVARLSGALALQPIELGSVSTDSDGNFDITLDPSIAGMRVRLTIDGDVDTWPATAEFGTAGE